MIRFGAPEYLPLLAVPAALLVVWLWQLLRRRRDIAALRRRRVTPVLDRKYFKSIYTTDPDGHIVELATLGPGFDVDEGAAELGTRLQLPDWLEARRDEITGSLRPLLVPDWPHPAAETA